MAVGQPAIRTAAHATANALPCRTIAAESGLTPATAATIAASDTPMKATTGNRGKFLVELAGGAAADAGQAAEQPTEVAHQNADTTRVVAQDERNLKIIFEAEFLEKTYLELYLDGQQRNTGLMLPGRKERWEATSTIQAKIGNAGGVKVRINGRDFAFGGKGQVANKIIKWEKDPASPNVYNIVVKDWK